MSVLRFRCGHGSDAEAAITLSRACPVCMMLGEQGRSREQLVTRVARGQRERLRSETQLGAEYDWVCTRGHDRYRGTVLAALDGDGCPKCRANASSPSGLRERGVPGMRSNLKLRTSRAEQQLRALLSEQIDIPKGVNRIRIARPFHGRSEVWPDIVIPALKVAIEYDSPGPGGGWHRGLRKASDLDKDEALREVGWEVIRVRTGGLEPLGRYCVIASGPTQKAAAEVLSLLETIRGIDAVTRIRHPCKLESSHE